MKKLILFSLLLYALCVFTPIEAKSLLTKDDIRSVDIIAKEYEREGWKKLGGGSIREGLKCVYEMQISDKYIILEGREDNKASLELALQYASRNALMELASIISSGRYLEQKVHHGAQIHLKQCFDLNVNFLPIPIMILYRGENHLAYDCINYYVINLDMFNHPLDYADKLDLNIYIKGTIEYFDEEESY